MYEYRNVCIYPFEHRFNFKYYPRTYLIYQLDILKYLTLLISIVLKYYSLAQPLFR